MLELLKSTPRKTMDVELHLSYRQLKTFLNCSFRFALRYVWGAKTENRPMETVLTYAVRRAVEEYYLHLKEHGQVLPLDRTLVVFESALKTALDNTGRELTFRKGQSLDSVRTQGMALVRAFHAGVHPQTIVDVEYPFAVPVPDIVLGDELPLRLSGIIDLIERDASGNHHAVALHIASRPYSGAALDFDLQSIVYSYAMTELQLVPSPESCLVRYDVLLNTDQPSLEQSFITRCEADHQRLIHLVNAVIRAIDKQMFYRNIGPHCESCPFRKACQPG